MRISWKPTDNTDRGEKIVIRKRLLSALPRPSVIECFAGSGKIHAECYRDIPYLGLDLKPINDGRNLLAVDNRKFLRMADLSTWNFFDLDAYGSPWHQFLIILKRRHLGPGEQIALALTDGLAFKMRMSDLPHGMKPYLGIPARMTIPCLARHQEFITRLFVSRAIAAAGLTVRLAFEAQNPRGNMKYYGLLLEKTAIRRRSVSCDSTFR